jgi:transposase
MAKPRAKPQLSLQSAHLYDDAAGLPPDHWCRVFYEEVYSALREEDFAEFYEEGGRAPISPALLVGITILQYMKRASDRAAVDQSLMRRDWRVALGRTPDYEGFDPSVLCNFRKRLVAHGAQRQIFDTIVRRVQELGLLQGHHRVRVDATELLADVAVLSRGDMLREALRIVVCALAQARPKLLRRRPDFRRLYEQYGEEVWLGGGAESDQKLSELARDAQLLLRLCGPYPVQGKDTLTQILAENFIFAEGREPIPKPPEALPPGHIATPHEPDAEVGKKGAKIWTGDKVHIVETVGPAGESGYVTDLTITSPRLPDAVLLPELMERVRFLMPQVDTILADSGYASAANSKQAAALGLDLISPPRLENSKGLYPASKFRFDFAREVASCPQGHRSVSWRVGKRLYIKFSRPRCRTCPCRAQCTSSASEPRTLTLSPNYEQLWYDRERAQRPEFAKLYRQRAGIEATISELVHCCGLRRSRYRSGPKRALHAFLSNAALNVRRLLRDRAAGNSPETTISSIFSSLHRVLRGGFRRPPVALAGLGAAA